MSDNRREPGYYWVKIYDAWHVAEYIIGKSRSWWMLAGSDEDFEDMRFQEIDERPIVREVK